jgi:hypothetical protein
MDKTTASNLKADERGWREGGLRNKDWETKRRKTLEVVVGFNDGYRGRVGSILCKRNDEPCL